MAGNVLEWAADWNGPYASDPATDPAGPATGTMRILRGGSFAVTKWGIRVSTRYAEGPDYALSTIGFRCAGDVKAR
jgi:formylglycine-generating enzyme required for sulfatase activity